MEIESVEFCGVGKVLGEVAILEHRPTRIHMVCETGVEAFTLERKRLESLMIEYPELEERLWRIRGISVAATLLGQLAEYKVSGGHGEDREGRYWLFSGISI